MARLPPRSGIRVHLWQIAGALCVLSASLGMADCGKTNTSAARPTLSTSAVQRAYLKASNTNTGDQLGSSVALDGDTLVVGAPNEDTTAAQSGAVYVFTRTGGTWTQQALLKASNADIGDHFGSSVAVDGDTLVVGAIAEDSHAIITPTDNSATDSGAVYVFTRTHGVWTQQAYLKASHPDPGDAFGSSLSLTGDTLVIGAPNEGSHATGVNGDEADNTAAHSGAAYVFTRNGTAWTQQAYLKASNSEAFDVFGASLALDGDTLVVGARGEASAATDINGLEADNSAGNSGAVYVFTRNGTTWAQQAYVKASNTGMSDFFGVSVALSGDTMAVGARSEASNATGINGNQLDDSAPNSGAVYIFVRHGASWTQQAYLKASNAIAWDAFGASLALVGDTLVVGATQEGSGFAVPPGTGAAYHFTRNGTTWKQEAIVQAHNGDSDDRFSTSITLDGDSLAVGATGEDSNATGVNGTEADNSASLSGAVFVFQ